MPAVRPFGLSSRVRGVRDRGRPMPRVRTRVLDVRERPPLRRFLGGRGGRRQRVDVLGTRPREDVSGLPDAIRGGTCRTSAGYGLWARLLPEGRLPTSWMGDPRM